MDEIHNSEYTQNDGWVMINTRVSDRGYTRSRSPQYNGDNEPSGHKANASTSPSRHNSFTFEDIESIEQAVNRKTVSNNSFDTTTSGTATLAGITAPAPQRHRSSERRKPAATQALTISSLHRYQEELAHQAAVNVPSWIAHAGMGNRLVQHQVAASAHGSMAVGRSMSSTAGSVSQGRGPEAQPSIVIDDIFAAGAWSDAPIDALLRSSSQRLDLG
ncbi:hypothetical protein V8F33_003944 [Rhypophila sp. PSN 637]